MKLFRLVFVLIFAGFLSAEKVYSQVRANQSRTMSSGIGFADATGSFNSDLRVVGDGWPEAEMLPIGARVPQEIDLERLKNGEIVDARGCSLEITQVIDEKNFLVSWGSATYWITGASTSGLSDGKRVRLCTPVMLDGKKEYQTVLSATKLVKKFSLLSIQEFNEKRSTELTLSSGDKKKLVYKKPAKSGHVFEDLNGSEVTYAMNDFDEESQKLVKKMIDQARKATKAKKK